MKLADSHDLFVVDSVHRQSLIFRRLHTDPCPRVQALLAQGLHVIEAPEDGNLPAGAILLDGDHFGRVGNLDIRLLLGDRGEDFCLVDLRHLGTLLVDDEGELRRAVCHQDAVGAIAEDHPLITFDGGTEVVLTFGAIRLDPLARGDRGNALFTLAPAGSGFFVLHRAFFGALLSRKRAPGFDDGRFVGRRVVLKAEFMRSGELDVEHLFCGGATDRHELASNRHGHHVLVIARDNDTVKLVAVAKHNDVPLAVFAELAEGAERYVGFLERPDFRIVLQDLCWAKTVQPLTVANVLGGPEQLNGNAVAHLDLTGLTGGERTEVLGFHDGILSIKSYGTDGFITIFYYYTLILIFVKYNRLGAVFMSYNWQSVKYLKISKPRLYGGACLMRVVLQRQLLA